MTETSAAPAAGDLRTLPPPGKARRLRPVQIHLLERLQRPRDATNSSRDVSFPPLASEPPSAARPFYSDAFYDASMSCILPHVRSSQKNISALPLPP